MFCISQAKKEAGRYCCAYNCTSKPVKKKGGLCHKHYARKTRLEDPVLSRFNDFKGNAKKRNKSCSVTLVEFRQFCKDNNYIVKPGRRGQNATIDRIRNEEGYHIGNMQILTHKRNSSKGTSSDYPF